MKKRLLSGERIELLSEIETAEMWFNEEAKLFTFQLNGKVIKETKTYEPLLKKTIEHNLVEPHLFNPPITLEKDELISMGIDIARILETLQYTDSTTPKIVAAKREHGASIALQAMASEYGVEFYLIYKDFEWDGEWDEQIELFIKSKLLGVDYTPIN